MIGAKKAYLTWADHYRADTINKIDKKNPATKAILDPLFYKSLLREGIFLARAIYE
jgi:hypothetical protein